MNALYRISAICSNEIGLKPAAYTSLIASKFFPISIENLSRWSSSTTQNYCRFHADFAQNDKRRIRIEEINT